MNAHTWYNTQGDARKIAHKTGSLNQMTLNASIGSIWTRFCSLYPSVVRAETAGWQTFAKVILDRMHYGVDATVDNMAAGTYKLQANGHMYSKGQPDGLTKAFLDYMLSTDVQKTLIPSLFYAPVIK